MGNIKITLKVPKELKMEMGKHPKADWSSIVIRAIKERLIFAKRTEEARKRYEEGEFKTMNANGFIKMLKRIQ